MRLPRLLIPIFITLLIASLSGVFIYFSEVQEDYSARGGNVWTLKEKEIRSRLLSVPILLYHNIDGKGIFSISSEQLRSHFKLFRDRGYDVVSLSDLMERLDNPRPYNKKSIVITFDDGYASMYDKLLPIAVEFNYPITLFVYTDFIYDSSKRLLTWEKLKVMQNHGVDIQCHTISHADLSAIEDLEDEKNVNRMLFNEIYLSKRIIELKMGRKIKYFAFPYGRYSLSILKMSREAGYDKVFTTNYGSNVLSRNNYSLRRHHVKKSYSLDTIENIIK